MAEEKKKRHLILVCDDEPALTILVGNTLMDEGYEVVTANNGPEAIKLAKEKKPDLAVLDVVMPEMEGWVVCEKLKAMFPPNFPVIMLTCKTGELNEIRSFECGADAYFSKPADFPSLLNAITGLLDQKKG